MQKSTNRPGAPLRAKGWFLTYPQCAVSKEILLSFLKALPSYLYAIVCQEKHELEGLHLHAYVKFSKRVQFSSTLFDFQGYHGNYQVAKSFQAVSRYIQKDGDYITDGPVPTTFTRKYTCLEMLTVDPKLLVEKDLIPWWRYKSLVESQLLWNLMNQAPYEHFDVRGLWIYGPPGTGKSRYIRDLWRSQNLAFYTKPQNKWFDGYKGEKCIVLDDLDTPVLGHYLKIWMDRYHCTGEMKGMTINLAHEQFVVTCNESIDELFSKESYSLVQAIKRRCKVMKFLSLGNWIYE